MSWHVLWAAEGLGGLRAGHTKLALPFSVGSGTPNSPWFCCASQGAEPHTPRGRSRLLPASLRLMAFNLEFNQCGFSPESWTLQCGSELCDLCVGQAGGPQCPLPRPYLDLALLCLQPAGVLVMEDCNVHSAASILASVKEQEARFERLTRALEQERRHVALQLERAQQPGVGSGGVGSGQPLPMAWQQLVLQVTAQ